MIVAAPARALHAALATERKRERDQNYRLLQIHSYSCAEPLVSVEQRAPLLTVQSTVGRQPSGTPLYTAMQVSARGAVVVYRRAPAWSVAGKLAKIFHARKMSNTC
jgi:hypothetical protein